MMRVIWILCALAGLATAGTKRVAIVVGNNAGNGDRPSLHYAEVDAGKFADVLREIGGVAPDDLFLLQGKSLAELDRTLEVAKKRVAAFHKDPTNRVVVLFYFSGHSDGEALELGSDRMEFSELRRWLAQAGADVRVALVDSCKSGALLAAKGGSPGPAFQIRLTDDVASTGEALLTSSAADEVALESREIGGSFFTHHFISGLRGAADASGDGTVTLTEAYQYAYAHTIKTTGETVIGPQHPAYDYRLSGQGELVLAELNKRSASLALPAGFERILISTHDQVVAEVTADMRGSLALQPGLYTVRAWRAGKIYGGRVTLAIGTQSNLRADELTIAGAVTTASKGGDAVAPTRVLVAADGSSGIAAGAQPGLRLQARRDRYSLELRADSSRDANFGQNFRETSILLLAGLHIPVVSGPRWNLVLGLEAGPGFILQSGLTMDAYSTALVAGPLIGVDIAITPQIAITAGGGIDGALLRRDGKASVVAIPNVFLGVVFSL